MSTKANNFRIQFNSASNDDPSRDNFSVSGTRDKACYTQREREVTLKEFVRGMDLILITSFQLSKGLGLPDVETVFVHVCHGNSRMKLRL